MDKASRAWKRSFFFNGVLTKQLAGAKITTSNVNPVPLHVALALGFPTSSEGAFGGCRQEPAKGRQATGPQIRR